MKGLMIQGTASNVGKSFIVTAICRWLSNQGYRAAPFKSQNMSNNSYVTDWGTEIGRAQGVQAEACRTPALPEMNPILLKPRNDQHAEVICLGKSVKTLSGSDYRAGFYEEGLQAIKQSLDKLNNSFDYIVIEGAGSPVEVNLNDRELVNMAVADLADVPVLLAADIDRGGVFASIVGTLELLPPHHRDRIKGIIINKFRGDPALFEDGRKWLEVYTGLPILGVLPHVEHHIEAEDSLSLRPPKASTVPKSLDLAVIVFPYVSNFTDVDPFYREKDVSIRYVYKKEEFGCPDAVLLPGTRSTIEDLKALRSKGLAEALTSYIHRGGTAAGICGGYQMLTRQLTDQHGSHEGLSILPMRSVFHTDKQTRKVHGEVHSSSGFGLQSVEGYEIHLGEVTAEDEVSALFSFNGHEEGAVWNDGKVIGTHLHHVFHNDGFRTDWLNRLRNAKQLPVRPEADQDGDPYDKVAEEFAAEVDTDALLRLLNGEELIP
ncbi:cobyric acid synthase [Halobacillus sp. Cin3]|uniref:cobyric acid synthase n=1 Tax=Halobacillus sp. Cin3 TaxID=2928441 RepID=UPI00248ED4DB|nr:cobyric acid synthase [Halobacillus sp. Cin3]